MAMLAVDQRESMRKMFSDRVDGGAIDNALLKAFKRAVATTLAPYASAILLDALYGEEAIASVNASETECGVILALDRLIHSPAGPITRTEIDPDVKLSTEGDRAVDASKMLILWSSDTADAALELSREFLDRSAAAGVPGVLEAIVRPPASAVAGAWSLEDEIVAAAEALGELKPDLYKCEVPFHGKGSAAAVAKQSERISGALSCPWVVLSSGVAAEDFPAAVEAACAGGASGFLAGRAIWKDAIGPGDFESRIAEISIPRIVRLAEIVEANARPWQAAVN
jgi:sulfofructosephosphate aldolase